MDRFWDVYPLQKAGIDLIGAIVQDQADMNVMSLKVPGLFGRLRRIKHQFAGSESIDVLLNGLFKVSAMAQEIGAAGVAGADGVGGAVEAAQEHGSADGDLK